MHAGSAGEPSAADVREADGKPERDRQVQHCEERCVAAVRKGVDVGEEGADREVEREPEGFGGVRCALPYEVHSKQREDKQAGVHGVEDWKLGFRRERNAEKCGHFDGESRCDCKPQDDELLGGGGARWRSGGGRGNYQLLPEARGMRICELA